MISKIDLDYAYDQIKSSEETSRQCVFAITGGNVSGYNRFNKGFNGLADFNHKIEEKCSTALDDIIVVTPADREREKT